MTKSCKVGTSIPDLAFFRFSQELDRPTAGTSPLAGKSDQLHSAPVLVSPPALPEVPQAPPLEGETSSGSGEDLGTPEEITFLCAESSCILHAGIAGRPACGCRGTFHAISAPDLSFTFLQVSSLQLHFHEPGLSDCPF